jgi:hypothetical protein
MGVPRKERINFAFDVDVDGEIEKLRSTTKTPHTGKGGEFLWELANNVGDDIEVCLQHFVPDATSYLDFTSTGTCVTVKDGKSGYLKAKVKKADSTTVRFTYEVWVNGSKVDPELEIDGGGDVPPEGKGRKRTLGKKR